MLHSVTQKVFLSEQTFYLKKRDHMTLNINIKYVYIHFHTLVYLHISVLLLPKLQLIGVNATIMQLMIIFRRL